MTRVLRPGPASMKGLEWLATAGPSPLDPWRYAMGWSEVAARNHARRLERQGWLERCPMLRGQGSLFLATRKGVLVLGPPEPTWWAHHGGAPGPRPGSPFVAGHSSAHESCSTIPDGRDSSNGSIATARSGQGTGPTSSAPCAR